MIGVAIAFVIAIEPKKKTMAQCRCLFVLKHKEEGDGSNCHYLLLFCNTTTEEDDNTLSSSFSLLQYN